MSQKINATDVTEEEALNAVFFERADEFIKQANEFCRPIRWALVSMREIVAMPTDILKLSDKTEIPISRLKRKEIQDAFANYSWRSTRRRMRGGIL